MDDKEQFFLKTTLGAIVVGHWFIIVGNTLAFFLLPFFSPWYIALPVMSYIALLCFSKVLDCPITKLENKIRKRMNLPEIKGFMGHYMIKPYKKAALKRKRKPKDGFDSYGMYR